MSELAFILILSGREKERERLKEGEIETPVKEERREEETDNTFLFCRNDLIVASNTFILGAEFIFALIPNIIGACRIGFVNIFDPLFQKYRWGTNFPYMLAGSSNLAQGQVMEWLGTNRYSVNSVIRLNDSSASYRWKFKETMEGRLVCVIASFVDYEFH